MNSIGLISCFVHCITKTPISLQEEDFGERDCRLPPITDILVIAEENISIIPKEYVVVLNQSEDAEPRGSIAIEGGKRGYLCIRRSFGHYAICSLKLFHKSQLKHASCEGYFIVKLYPEGRVVNFGYAPVLWYSCCRAIISSILSARAYWYLSSILLPSLFTDVVFGPFTPF